MHRLARASIAMLFAVGAAACQSSTAGPGAGLATARARWAARGPDSDAVTVSRSCECLPEMAGPVRVVVSGKVVQSRTYLPSGTPVSAQYAPDFPSVDELFAMIDAAIKRGDAKVTAEYDRTLGYPKRFVAGDPAVDAPVYTMSDFEAR